MLQPENNSEDGSKVLSELRLTLKAISFYRFILKHLVFFVD